MRILAEGYLESKRTEIRHRKEGLCTIFLAGGADSLP